MILLLYILSSKYGIAELALVPFEINVPLITTNIHSLINYHISLVTNKLTKHNCTKTRMIY